MAEKRIVVVRGEACRFAWIGRALARVGLGRVRRLKEVDDLSAVLDDDHVALVVYVRRGMNDRTRLARTLCHVSRADCMPVPVVVIDRVYDEADALTFLRMGATDYLSVTDHGDCLGSVIARLVASVGGAGRSVEESPESLGVPHGGVAHARTVQSQAV